VIPAIANHLLQSTVFAVVAGIVTLALRNNRARTRYWIWLTASMKFLVPFSLFVEIGHRLSWQSAPAIASQPRLAFVVDEISQPFVVAYTVPVASAPSIMPELLPGIWICGCAAVLIFWLLRWRRVAAILRASVPVSEGRELSALRRIDSTTALIFSQSQMEPGVFGILRPVLSLPTGISSYLDDAQLDAIFAHELCHVRRRDNLTAALHMLVEAVFWFHPLVWWIGTKLVEERERACDEDVVRQGSDPEIYAESILKICRLYLASPLPCTSGISGSDLSKRIENIMSNPVLTGLSHGKKLMIGTLGMFALAAPIAVGIVGVPAIRAQANSAPPPETSIMPTFEVASVKPFHDDGGPRNSAVYGPNGITFGGLTLAVLIGEAYRVPVGRIQGADSLTKEELWAPLRQGYDIVAKADHPVSRDQLRLMLQSLLADRFRLKLHRETREGSVYRLVVARSGPKLEESETSETFLFTSESRGYVFRNADMVRFSAFLSGNVDRSVVDQTGLKEVYNFVLRRPDGSPQDPTADKSKSDGRSADSPSAAAFANGLKQLGLELIAGKVPVDYLVIDSVEKPSEN
jgi:bla regulator protein BlaR1